MFAPFVSWSSPVLQALCLEDMGGFRDKDSCRALVLLAVKPILWSNCKRLWTMSFEGVHVL